jgi:hypothetical protein
MKAVQREEGIPRLVMLVYGPPGCGKTTFGASFNLDPRTGPALLVDMSGRPETVKYVDPSLRVLRLEDVKEINQVYSFLNLGQADDHPLRKALDPPLKPGEKFKTVVLDTFTEYQQYEMAYLFAGQRQIGMVKDLTEVPAAKGVRDWGLVAPNTIIPCQAFCDLPVNVVMTLQEFTQIDIAAGTTRRRPRLAGQAMDIVPQYFNMQAVMVWKKKDPKDETPGVLLLWSLESSEGYTKQDWMRGCTKVGMWDPSATKLWDLAEDVYNLQEMKQ